MGSRFSPWGDIRVSVHDIDTGLSQQQSSFECPVNFQERGQRFLSDNLVAGSYEILKKIAQLF